MNAPISKSQIVDIKAPEGQQEGTRSLVTRWLKQVGDRVTEHEPLVELETDKVAIEIAAPASGLLTAILMDIDTEVSPGDVMGRIDTAAITAETAPVVQPAPAATPTSTSPNIAPALDQNSKTRLSPLVKRLLQMHDLSPAQICGTGLGGRITKDDVTAHVETRGNRPVAPVITPAPAATSAPARPSGAIKSHLVPHDNMRKRIAAHMVESLLHTAPHVTSVFEADLSRVMAHRNQHKAEFAARGINLTYTAYFVAACIDAIRAVPAVNSRYHENALEIFDDINIGIGTALEDKGLIVPVIHKAQELNLAGIAARLHDMSAKARTGRLDARDVQNGTFTISNHGVSGSLLATPIIINQPQSAILGIGKLEKRLTIVEVDGQDTIQIRPKCYVTLTIDHRVLDGFQTNSFLTQLLDRINNWQ
jgi:2-oxoglutarate dehydrogenase E2 component (dihydrolipoamide succinyltransferase)